MRSPPKQASPIALTSADVLAALAYEHLTGLHDVFVAPDLPARKEAGARAAHALHLRDREPIVVLFDSTVLGGAEEGFVATPSQLCWKNTLEHPRSITWDALAEARVEAFTRHVSIAGGRMEVPWSAAAAAKVRAFVTAVAAHARAPRPATYRSAPRLREPESLAERIVDVARRALGELDFVHYCPSIPRKMEAAIRVVHARHLAPDDPLLVVYDDTLFGSGNDGIVLTERGVCWRSFWGTAEARSWRRLAAERVASDGDLLLVGAGGKVDLRMRPGMARTVAGVLREAADLASSSAPAPA